jgi:hypothetical protein
MMVLKKRQATCTIALSPSQIDRQVYYGRGQSLALVFAINQPPWSPQNYHGENNRVNFQKQNLKKYTFSHSQ